MSLLSQLFFVVPKQLPSYKNFRGVIHELGQNQYLVSGEVSVIDRNTIEITELPIRTWTQVQFNLFSVGYQGIFVTVNRICIVCFSPPVCRPIRNLCWSPCCRALTKHQPSSVTTRNTTQTPQSSLWFACLKRNSPRLKQLVSTKSSNCSPALPATQW